MKSSCYIIPCSITEDNIHFFAPSTLHVIYKIDHFIVEKAKTARRFLKSIQHPTKLQEIDIEEMGKKDTSISKPLLLEWLSEGKNVGILSESGMPGIADPGSIFALEAHHHGFRVIPLIGPSSISLALAASGLNGQHFCFNGYLPIDKKALSGKIRQLESLVRKFNQTQIWIETPYRNDRMYEMLLNYLNERTLLCIATDINGPNEMIRTKPMHKWYLEKVSIGKIPTVFIIGR